MIENIRNAQNPDETFDASPDVLTAAAQRRLRSFIARVQRLNEDRAAVQADIKEVFAEAKGEGFDTKVMRQVIRIRRMDEADLHEQEELIDVYKRALGMLPDGED